jgi:branched-subunit amino acid transport protein AzlD
MIHAALIILVAAACTLVTRAAPFLLFRDRELPGAVVYLGKILPAAIMATLVVYCLRSTGFAAAADFAPQLIAVAVVAALHVWRRNTLLSIFAGTAVYMVLVQQFF